MRMLGLIGGIGPESTVDYYRALLAEYRTQTGRDDNPPILINSVDITRMIRWLTDNELQKIIDYLTPEVERLARAGAHIVLLCANTAHIVFDELQRRSQVPLLSIVEAAYREVRRLGVRRPMLLGTRFTMQAAFYPKVFAAAGIPLVTPNGDDQAYIHDKYLNELLKNIFLRETREGLMAIVNRMVREEKVDAVILAGTELPLILREAGKPPVPFLDTTLIHVKAAVTAMLAEGGPAGRQP